MAMQSPFTVYTGSALSDFLGSWINGSGLTLIEGSLVYTGAEAALASFESVNFGSVAGEVGQQSIALSNSGLLLTTGYANLPLENTESGFTGIHANFDDPDAGRLGYEPLEAILDGVYGGSNQTFDAAVLTFELDVAADAPGYIAFDVLFGSEEYPVFIDSFVDIAGIFVNDVNYADFALDPQQLTQTTADPRPLSVLSQNVADGYFIANISGNGFPAPSDFSGQFPDIEPPTLEYPEYPENFAELSEEEQQVYFDAQGEYNALWDAYYDAMNQAFEESSLSAVDAWPDNVVSRQAALDIEYNGMSAPLTIRAPVNPGETNTITIAIADTGDAAWDSGIFVANLRSSSAAVSGVSQVFEVVDSPMEVAAIGSAEIKDSAGIDAQITHKGKGMLVFEGMGGNNSLKVDGDGGTIFAGGSGNDTFQVLTPSPFNSAQVIDLSKGGNNTVKTGGGNDLITLGEGSDNITLQGGYDTVAGTLAAFKGDTIHNFNAGHMLQLQGITVEQSQLQVEAGSARLMITTEGDQVEEIYLTGDFELKNFVVEANGSGDTLIRYIDPAGDATDSRSTANDTLIPVNATTMLRGGGGDDRYELHGRIQQDIQLVDTEGSNRLFINEGLTFDNISFSRSGVKFDLADAGSVSVLGDMDTFTFVLGGNVRTGEVGDTALSFTQLQEALGVPAPASGIAEAGAWEVGVAGWQEWQLLV